MLKFSNLSGQQVNSEPKIELNKEMLEMQALKASIFNLIDKTLTIRHDGDYRHTVVMNKIEGKEMFVEELLNFLSEKENKKAITYLESLKESNGDWKSIDCKISEIERQNQNLNFLKENSEHLNQIKSFLDKYALSEDFNDILEIQILKITDPQIALLRSKIASIMLENEQYNKYPKNSLRAIANKFNFRASQLV
jgi:hypothetical protein